MATQNQGEQSAEAAPAPLESPKATNTNDAANQQQQQPKNRLKRPRPPVAVVTTTGCPFCSRIKGALNFAGVAFYEVDLASSPDALAAVKAATGRSTVPQVKKEKSFSVERVSRRRRRLSLVLTFFIFPF